MTLFDPRDILVRSADFTFREGEGGLFFVNREGLGVQTDEAGKLLWNCLPGEAAAVIRRAKAGVVLSEDLLEIYLFVLFKAGILESASQKGQGAGGVALDVDDTAGISAPAVEGGRGAASISVIVVAYNGGEHIRECLSSLREQSLRPLEILVVDNASSDDTVKIVREDFPEARVSGLDRNRHFAVAVNHGIQQVRGSLILVLNQDLALEADCLSRLRRKMMSGARIAAVVPQMRFFRMRGFVNGIGNHVRNHGWGSDNFIGMVDVGQFEGLEEVPSACFGAVLLSRAAVKDVGRLDGGYGSYYEDVDWSFRSWLRGWRIVPAPDALVYHKFGGSYQEEKKLRFIVGNRVRLVLKTFQGRILFGFLKRYLKEDLKAMSGFVRRGKASSFAAYLQSYIRLALALPRIGVQRALILRSRASGIREEDVLKKNPPVFSGLNDSGQPVIDTSMIFGYYMWDMPHAEGEK